MENDKRKDKKRLKPTKNRDYRKYLEAQNNLKYTSHIKKQAFKTNFSHKSSGTLLINNKRKDKKRLKLTDR